MTTKSAITSLYQEVLLEQAHHPSNFGELSDATHQARGSNPLCGDQLTVQLRVKKQQIRQIKFKGSGCALCLASASLMTEVVAGQDLKKAQKMIDEFLVFLKKPGSKKTTMPNINSKLKVFATVAKFPVRVKCVSLPWHTLRAALASV